MAAAATGAATTAGPAQAATQSDLDQAIASIALSQVGVSDTPAVTNFAIDCDPYSTLVAGFSANADGCGYDTTFSVRNENETWCADFNKWVWQQAGVTADMNTLNAGAVSFYDWAGQQGETPAADTGTPAAGDCDRLLRALAWSAVTPTTSASSRRSTPTGPSTWSTATSSAPPPFTSSTTRKSA